MSEPRIDWDAVTREATDLLSRYIAVDTTNPPGNEVLACRFLEQVLRDNGVDEIEFYDASDAGSQGRLNMRAVLRGDGSKRPLILLNHTDVVPVEREGWDEEPFAGVVKDGVIWGRGALDMKSMGIMELITFLLLKRHGVPLRRDVVFFAVADEEAGSRYGVEFLAEHHPETLDAEFVLNEGGWGTNEVLGTRRPAFNCSVSEKGPFWVTLRAHGRPGHGSVPHDDNALARLVRALHRIDAWQRPRELVPEFREYLSSARREGYLAEDPTEDWVDRVSAENPLLRALTRHTVSLTTARAGVKHNVIPASAEATIDCRLLPGTDSRAFLETLRELIDDPKVELDIALDSSTPSSPVETELMSVVRDVVRHHVEEAAVLPSVSAGFTDSRVFRRRGVVAYGFIPVLLEPGEAATIHGHNERLSVENLGLGCRMLFDVVRRMAGR